MARIQKFHAMFAVDNTTLHGVGIAAVEATVRREITLLLDRPLRGPRGGTYIPFGEITIDASDAYGDVWLRNETAFRGTRMGRYVRPHAIPLTDPPHGD